MRRAKYGFKISFNMERSQLPMLLHYVGEGFEDNLVVLDSCRYDYFEQEYDRFLDGELTKVISPASTTVEWMKKTWKGFYSLTYVSAMSGINSKGFSPRFWKYRAIDHFFKIIDVWDFGWNDELGTVPPENVNDAVLKMTDRRGLVIHFAQPHIPYIGETTITFPREKPRGDNLGEIPIMGHIILNEIEKGNVTFSMLRKAYRDNLRLVLKVVAELLPHLEGKTIITADHGDLLGEGGKVWHWRGSYDPRLKEVPWFEVK